MSLLGPEYLDPALPLSKNDRKEIYGQAWKRWLKQRVNLSLYIIVIVALNLAADLAWRAYRGAAGPVPWWHWVIAGAVFLIVLYGVLLLLQRWRFAPLARQIVREQGFRLCAKCGRWLKDEPAPADRCAACGARQT
jgi:hypothetical protein